MSELAFAGNVVNGVGNHSELVVPGKDGVAGAPDDWPEILCKGSLNVLITGYPPEFSQRGIPLSAKSLDVCGFLPEFCIAQALMLSNKLRSEPESQ